MNYTLDKNDFKLILQYWIRIFHLSSILIVPKDIYNIIVLYIDIFILSICPHYNPSNMLKFNLLSSNISPKLLVNIGKDLGIKNLNSTNIKVFDKNGDEINKYYQISQNDRIYLSNGLILEDKYTLFYICMLGNCCGKSAMVLQYIQGQFVPDYDPTIEDSYRKNVIIDGNQILLDVLDTQGNEDFCALRASWMRNKDGFILAFDITSCKTFEGLEAFYDQLCDIYEDQLPPMVLCGNRSDISEYREVSYENANKLAQKWNCCEYIEVSAKTGNNIKCLYSTIVRYILAPLLQHQMSKIKVKSQKKCNIM